MPVNFSLSFCWEYLRFYLLGFLDHAADDEQGEGIVLEARDPWEGSDRDYEYEEVWLLFSCYMITHFMEMVDLSVLQTTIRWVALASP